MMTGAQFLVDRLARSGVRLVAGIPGGAVLPLYAALADSRIRHVLVRHEQAAGFVAQGYARLTGEPGVCLASSGPGATNLLTAVADAKCDSIPLIVITGQVARPLLGTDAFQEVDTVALARPVTKGAWLVRSAEALRQVLPEALALATTGRPGPVWLDIPRDVQTEILTGDLQEPCAAQPAPVPGDDALARAARAIQDAERPLLYLGGGLVRARAQDLARDLSARQDIPAVMTLMALGTLASDCPLSLGMLGMHAQRVTHKALQEADLLIALGARFDDRATGRLDAFCPQARVIHADIDARELGKLRVPDIALHGDLKSLLTRLLPLLPKRERSVWRARLAVLRRTYPPADGARGPRALIRAIAEQAPADAVITTDVGQHQMWVAQHYPLRDPMSWLTSGGLGTMGFGLPAAIGAALADGERTVICFTGDGSLLMNIQELATVCEQDLDIKVIVMDNGALGLVAQQQRLSQGAPFASVFPQAVDFVTIARGFGIPAFSWRPEGGEAPPWSDILTTRGPCLVHVAIDACERVLPIVPPGAAHWEALE